MQEVANDWRARDAAGKAVPNPFTPRYWEAWHADGSGQVTPELVESGHDRWRQTEFRDRLGAVEGRWSTEAKLYFTGINPATQGFIRNNPATQAGFLLSSTSAPAGLGPERLYRHADGIWDSTRAVPTHTGTAGP